MEAFVANWWVDRIESNSWFQEGDAARVFGSNSAGDSCSFQIYKIPEGDVALLDINFDWKSENWWDSVTPSYVKNLLQLEAVQKLTEWEAQIQNILSWLPTGLWKKGPGNDFQFEYSALAFLKDELSEFGGLKTNEVISKLLKIPMSTVVQRIRECRNRGLLSSPGQGIRGHSILTAKARKLLEERGVIIA